MIKAAKFVEENVGNEPRIFANICPSKCCTSWSHDTTIFANQIVPLRHVAQNETGLISWDMLQEQ